MYIFYLSLFLSLAANFLYALSEEDYYIRRIQAHLTICDLGSALNEVQNALTHYPYSIAIHETHIRTLAKLGDERSMLKAWKNYLNYFPDKSTHRELIEEMAWGVLQKASTSSSLVMREMALLAAYFSQESKGVTILHQGMRDSNYAIRSVAVKLAGHFRDAKLVEEVKRLFKTERVWTVRQRVLEAIGNMKIASLQSDLEDLIASNESLAEEKALAITSLLELLETINRSEIERLVASRRSGLRRLACQAIAHFQSIRDIDQLLQLVDDPQADVRLEAFQAMGQLRSHEQIHLILNAAQKGIQDPIPEVALSAIWLMTLYDPEKGHPVFLRFLNDPRRDVRYLAAAALSATGRYGIPLILQQFQIHSDPYVKLNLALGLIGQRIETAEAAAFLRYMLINEKNKWSTIEVGLFRSIVNHTTKKTNDPLSTSEVGHQLLCLELLNLLAILKDSGAQEAIRDYLMERSWGISATAAALLLTECDESAIKIVQQLLQDRQPRVRLQAALVLSLWGREESAIQVLEEGFLTSEWELKAKILEGLGRIGSMRSIPFLIQALHEPSQTLRLIAAMAIIQCLNH